jgi:hypothetical protein
MDLGDEWVVSEGCSDPSLQRLHGVYLRHGDGLQLHVVRHVGQVPRSVAELRALLRQQNWASAPYDEVIVDDAPIMASALFEMLPRDIVLEGFVTDGRQCANFAMPGPPDAVIAARSAAERLARSLRFEAP